MKISTQFWIFDKKETGKLFRSIVVKSVVVKRVSYILLKSLGACVHINAALLGFGTSTQGRKRYSVKPTVALGPDDFPDTTESPESEDSKRARHRMN